MRRMKIGLALGSGAAKGLAHIGVIRALEENDISVDVVSGTSMGAVIGSLYAAGVTVSRMCDFAEEFGKKSLASWMDPSFFRGGGMIKGDKIVRAVEEMVGVVDFRELHIPFYVVATDLVTGEGVVISEGRVVRAVRASFAIPGVFSPVRYKERWLVDGALVTPIPTEILRQVKCDMVIGVNVSSFSRQDFLVDSESRPGLVGVIMQALALSQQKMAEPCMRLADINIVPDVAGYEWTDFSHAEEIIEAGYDAAKELMPKVKGIISRKRKLVFLKRLFRI